MALFSKLNIKERSYRTPFFQSQMTQQQTRVTVVHLVAESCTKQCLKDVKRRECR